MANQADRLSQLDQIEKEISNALQYAGHGLQEMTKDKPTVKHVEQHTTNFLKALEKVEIGLSKNIQYLTQVSTGQPHEGSSYAAQKDLQMAFHRLEHVRSRLAELEKIKNEHTQPQQTMGWMPTPEGNVQRSMSQPGDHLTQQQQQQALQRTFSGDPSGNPAIQRTFPQTDNM